MKLTGISAEWKYHKIGAKVWILEAYLLGINAKVQMEELTSWSMDYLRAILYSRYGSKASREIFTEESLWRTPGHLLKEYPIILSTFAKYKISLLRLPTNGSGEIEKVRTFLLG